MAATLGIGTARLVRGKALLAPLQRRSVKTSTHRTSSSSAASIRTAATTTGQRRPSSARGFSHGSGGQRFSDALRNSKITWYQIPVGLGIGFLALVQFYKVSTREQERQLTGDDEPKLQPRIRPEGPWQVQVMSTLPLKVISRLWGRFNELTIPYYLRVPGFKLYSWIFGVNLDEVSEPDLHAYPNLAAFFYRTLKTGARPLDPDPQALLSPADGKILQYGQIDCGNIEQVKGMTYTVDALLGKHTPGPSISRTSPTLRSDSGTSVPKKDEGGDEDVISSEEEFARVNGISYTLPDLFSGQKEGTGAPAVVVEDQSTTPSPKTVSQVRADLAQGDGDGGSSLWHDVLLPRDRNRDRTASSLYYAVIYLAPGDYHRFHSPANWVVERRRHFAGELFSVSPYLQRTLPGLFTLNERVVLLGRWRWGFFAYVPVGATNVGSIRVNFDRELRTNSLVTDTAADRAAADAARNGGEPYHGFAEATYAAASPVLHGHALRRGEEMGGFQLGSTIVLVFEAPAADGTAHRGWEWKVSKGQKIKMGQALGRINTGTVDGKDQN